jgi:hypothetical protein
MALIKCKECNHQISNQAKTCPSCGCPVELNKGSLTHWMGIGFTVAITLLLIYAIFQPSKPLTPEEKAAKSYIEACKNDYTSCNNNADLINNYSKIFDATRACQDVIEDKTKYGVEWPVFPFGSFSSGEDYPETSAILIADKQLKVKNEFGTFGKAIAKCRYNLASSKVIMATLDEKIIYADTSATPIAYKNIVDVASTNAKIKTASDKLSSVWFKQDFQYGADKIRVVFIKSQLLMENGDIDACHSCTAEITAITYKLINNAWQFVAIQKNIKVLGEYGDVPDIKKADIITLSPEKLLFMLGGSTALLQNLYVFSQNKWDDLGYIPINGDDSDYCGEKIKCYKFAGEISVIPSEKEYPDLLVTKTGTELDEKQNIIKAKNSVYIFKNGKYADESFVNPK